MKKYPLKICAAIAMLLIPLPLMLMFDSAAFKEEGIYRFLLYYLTAIPAVSAGYLLQKVRASQTKPKRIFLSSLSMIIALIIMFVITGITVNAINESTYYSFNGTYVVFALLPAISLWFLLGIKLTRKSFSDVYTPLWLCIFMVETFLCYIFAFFLKEDHPNMVNAQSAMAYLVIVMALIVALLINQSNIETQINQRKNTNLIVPKGLKSYNAKLIILVGSVILLAMLFRNILADILWWLIQNTLRLIDSILQLIKMETSAPITPDGTTPDSPFIGIQQGGADFTIYLVFIVALVLVIIFRKRILAFFKSVAMRIFDKFSSKESETSVNENYTDYYEVIVQQTSIAKPETESDCLKRYKKEKNDTEKYRLGYRLYLMWLAKRSKNMSNKLTVEQQKSLAKTTYHGDSDIMGISDSYAEIRYNDKIADADNILQMDELINELYR